MYNEIKKMVQVSHSCLTGKAALPYKPRKNGTLVPKMITLKLQETLENLPAELRKAGTWVLEHQVEAATMSLRGIARAAGVHPNSVTRLTRELGYDSFQAFREPLRQGFAATTNFPDQAAWLQSLHGKSARDHLFADMAADSIKNIETLFQGMNIADLEAAAQLITQAASTYVLGVGMAHSLADNFAYMVGMAFDNVVAVPAAGALPVDALARATKGDVLLAMTFKPYRTEVVEAVEVAREQGVIIIALSDSPAAPILRGAAYGFIVPTQTPQFFTSTIALAAFLETLMAFVISNSTQDAVESIKQFHERRHALGIYWENAS